MYLDPQEFLDDIARPLGGFYLAACAVNLGVAVWARRARRGGWAALGSAAAAGFGLLGILAFRGDAVGLPEPVKAALNAVLGPITLTVGVFAGLVVFYLGRRLWVIPAVAWAGLDASFLLLGLSLADPHFAATVARPDNLPVVGLVYLLGFFTWLSTAQAVRNDDRLRRGQEPVENDYRDPVPVWPTVVYLELIGIVIGMTLLLLWSLAVRAPLAPPADPIVTPNPSKAPWYFVGLQEMLVYFPPWMSGVALPALIILGLMAIPYLDVNRLGNGYYTISRRRFAVLVFQFGFLGLWVVLILIGTFLRGPNWDSVGLYASQEPYRASTMTNVSLAEYCWVGLLGRSLPQATPGSGVAMSMGRILLREIFGLAALAIYYLGLPILLRWTLLRRLREAMGPGRFWIMTLLLLTMLLLPVKMALQWTLHLGCLVRMPEYFFWF